MAQPGRSPSQARIEDLLGSPEEQKAERQAVARLRRRYRRYAGTIEETQAAVDKAMGDELLSDYILEARKRGC